MAQAEADLAVLGADRERDLAARELRALGVRALGVRALGGRRARWSRPRHHADGASRLSARERQVAGLVANGLTNRQIAAQLAITDNTVETHLKRIFAKLDVSSRAALAAVITGSHTTA